MLLGCSRGRGRGDGRGDAHRQQRARPMGRTEEGEAFGGERGTNKGVEAAPRRGREASRWPGDTGRQPGGVAPAGAPCAVPPLPTGRG